MALAETANLIVNLQLKGGFARSLGKEARALGKFDARLDKTESRAFRAGQQIGTGIRRGAALAAGGLAILAGNVFAGLDSLVELEKQQKQTEAAIKSTGGAAGITAKEIRALAEKYEALNATVGDEVIQETENLLLSFTNIRKKAFEPTLETILDINTRLGRGPEGLAGTARIVGKALNDPEKGLGALNRLGITFDKKQTARIKKLQKEGKLYEAQGLILKELQKRFGGAFGAEGGTTAGRVAKFKDAIEDLQRTLAAGLFPVVGNIADALSELFADPEVQKGVEAFGKDLAALFTKDKIKSGIAAIKDIATTIGGAFKAAAGAIGPLIDAFNKLPPDLRNLLIGAVAVNKVTGGLVTNVAGGLASAIGSALKTIVAGNVTVIGKSVITPGGGVPAAAGAAGAAGTVGVGAFLGPLGIAAGIAEALKPTVNDAFKTNFPNPFEGGIGGGIITGLKTLSEVVRVLPTFLSPKPQHGGKSPDERDELAGAVETGLKRWASSQAALNATRRDEHGPRSKAPGASTRTQNEVRELASKLTPIDNNTKPLPGAIASLQDKSIASINAMKTDTTGSVDRMKDAIGSAVDENGRSNSAQAAITRNAVRTSSSTNAAIISTSIGASTSAIVGAIYAARPVVNVTNVTKQTTISNRYGPSSGSSNQNYFANRGD